MILPIKRGTDLKTRLLKARHMSRPTFFYLGFPNSILKPAFSNACGLLVSCLKGLSTPCGSHATITFELFTLFDTIQTNSQ